MRQRIHSRVWSSIMENAGRAMARIRDRRRSFRHELSVGAIFRDAADDLDEWLAFHAREGVDHFYLYNDRSKDHCARVLEPWIQRGAVTLISWPDLGQVAAYNDCVRRCRNRTRWLALIDMDEFLFSPRHAGLKEALAPYRDLPGVFVYWVLYGSSGHARRPEAPVLESYTRCMDPASAVRDDFDHRMEADLTHYVTGWSQDGKSVVNPRLVRRYNVHQPGALWAGALLDENRVVPSRRREGPPTLSVSTLRINHYWSKSLEELAAKVRKGCVYDRARPDRILEDWLKREALLNGCEDRILAERCRTPDRQRDGK